jgi:mannose-6-phosphate isomerase-like protein (cupin superfamily)
MMLNEGKPTDYSTKNRQPAVLHRADWAVHEQLWKGYFQGEDIGTGVTVLFYVTDDVGVGPRWHVHPYDEIFIVRTGNALFTIGDKKIEAKSGDILLGPANIPHKYHNTGPGTLETTDIHLSERWIQTNLDDPELVEN